MVSHVEFLYVFCVKILYNFPTNHHTTSFLFYIFFIARNSIFSIFHSFLANCELSLKVCHQFIIHALFCSSPGKCVHGEPDTMEEAAAM